MSIDVCQVDFGRCDSQGFIEQKTLNITNHTKGKITIVWMGNEDHVFSVTPVTCDIPPLKMSAFRITFKPVSILYITYTFSGTNFQPN